MIRDSNMYTERMSQWKRERDNQEINKIRASQRMTETSVPGRGQAGPSVREEPCLHSEDVSLQATGAIKHLNRYYQLPLF